MKTILVTEDNADIRESVREILELSDYQVITAENGKEGLHLSRVHVPHVIISDLMMPEMDGAEFLRQVRAHPATCTIPFLFVTGCADVSEKRAALALGANGYICKPFTAEELLQEVERVIGP